MRGRIDPKVKSDGAHIGLREAYRWSADLDAPGSTTWYRNDVTAWGNRFNRSNDGVSLAEERDKSDSLYTFYRRLLALRTARAELRQGDQQLLCDDASTAVCMLRRMDGREVLVLANTGTAAVRPSLPGMGQGWVDLLDQDHTVDPAAIELSPYGLRVLGRPN